MLFLAKAEHGLPLQQLQSVDLVEQIAALFDFYNALAAEKNIRLQQQGQGKVLADAAMLRRALSNLISNAIKYGHADSLVEIQYVV